MSSNATVPSVSEVQREVILYFHYWPSKSVAIVALVLFLLVAVTVTAMTIRTRAWYMLVAVGVAVLEAMGYVCRIRMLSHPAYGVYVAMQCLLIIPPSFLALVQYMTLGKVVAAVQRSRPDAKLPVRGSVTSWIYFAIEIGSLAMQGAGAGLSVSKNSDPDSSKLGRNLLLVGLALLVAVMLAYLANAIYVHAKRAFGIRDSRSLSRLFATLYVTTALLLVRNIYRLIEFADGFYGSLATNEKLFYILDALMVFLTLAVYTISHYGVYFNGYRRELQRLEGAKFGPPSIEVASMA